MKFIVIRCGSVILCRRPYFLQRKVLTGMCIFIYNHTHMINISQANAFHVFPVLLSESRQLGSQTQLKMYEQSNKYLVYLGLFYLWGKNSKSLS